MSKDDLVARAEALGIDGARKFTKVELIDEIARAGGNGERGLLGRARDLLRGVVEKGLGQPKTKTSPPPPAPVVVVASVVASKPVATPKPVEVAPVEAPHAKLDTTPEPPVPTVTLAEIYVEQGHVARAKAILREVLRTNDKDAAARALLAKLERDGESNPTTRVEPGALPDDPYARVGIEPEAFVEPVAARAPDVPSMLDDAPFPARYNVDECVAMAVDPTTVYVYWETRRATIERARRALARSGEGEAKSALRVLVVEPHERGPRVSTRDFEIVDLELGEWFIRDLPASSIVRAAIGLLRGDRFLPLAHTLDVEAPADRPSNALAHDVVTWSEGGTVDGGSAPALTPIGELARDVGTLGLPPMPEIPGEDQDARGLSSAELARRVRRARARASAEADRAPGPGSSERLVRPGSASWLSR